MSLFASGDRVAYTGTFRGTEYMKPGVDKTFYSGDVKGKTLIVTNSNGRKVSCIWTDGKQEWKGTFMAHNLRITQ